MATTVTLDGLNLNDRALYFLMAGFDPGQNEVAYDEFRSYAGGVSVTNASTAHTVQLQLPIDVRATSEAAMLAGVAAINAKIAGCHFAAPKNLVVGADTFQVIDSTQVRPVRDELYAVNCARLTIALNRLP